MRAPLTLAKVSNLGKMLLDDNYITLYSQHSEQDLLYATFDVIYNFKVLDLNVKV